MKQYINILRFVLVPSNIDLIILKQKKKLVVSGVFISSYSRSQDLNYLSKLLFFFYTDRNTRGMWSDISCLVIQGGRYFNITFCVFVTVKESISVCRAEGSLHDKSQLTFMQQKSHFTVSFTWVNRVIVSMETYIMIYIMCNKP